ncbi:MAG: thiamine-phosphate kinase, partial [Deltaproteobacteria bacterium]|nr:thiamine-phosphate kinase [Deltaproteobacteria bacterium]
MSSELSLIADFAAVFRGNHPGLLTGIGDDCAVLGVGDASLLLTVDAFVEDVHFRRSFAAPRRLGSRAAAAALSDVAAMGGEPLAILVTAALGPAWTPDDARELAEGIAARAREAGAAVVGGDTTRSPGPLFLDLAVLGRVPPGGRAILRAGALPGDLLAVTGFPGEAGLGLRHLLGELPLPPGEAERVVTRHLD